MIPKIIHYCWFGGNPLTKLAERCLESWGTNCPDYEIIRWDESNFDVNCCDYVREAYEAKKWAFVSDYARLYALVNCGGVYVDTDAEIIRPLDAGIMNHAAVTGFNSDEFTVPTAFMACEAHFPLFEELLAQYNTLHFRLPDGSLDQTTNVKRITDTLLQYGLVRNNRFQIVRDLAIYPMEYFEGKDNATGQLQITEHTYALHYYASSWLPNEKIRHKRVYRALCHIFGPRTAQWVKDQYHKVKGTQ